MAEVLHLCSEDAGKYGEEAATVLYVIRFNMKMHEHWQPEDWIEFDGIKHLQMSDALFEGFLPYKTIGSIKRILKRLQKINVISIKDGNYYVTFE